MSSQRAILSAFKLQKSLSHPYALMRASRIGVVNRYRYVSEILNQTNLVFNRITLVRTSTLSAR